MTEKELNDFLKKHDKDIQKFSKLYKGNLDYEDFYQELMIKVYNHMKSYYDPNIQSNPDILFYSSIGNLSLNIYRKMSRERTRESKRMKILEEELYPDIRHRDLDYSLYEIIDSELTEFEKQIVASIEYFCSTGKFSYKQVSNRMGITTHLLYYYIKNIRKKLKAAIESSKIS